MWAQISPRLKPVQLNLRVPMREVLSIALLEGEENFVGDSEIIALGGASNETKDRPLG